MSSLSVPWQHLGSEDFQRLVSELLMGVLGWLDFKPGPLRGPDGGWDGRYWGELPFDVTSDLPVGLWMVDAKHYQPNRKSAYQQLRDELRIARSGKRVGKSPIEKAIAAGADYLLIVTSAELRGDQCAELEMLADETDLKALRVMGRVALDPLVRERPWLLDAYFGVGPSPLVPLDRWNVRIPERSALPFRSRPTVLGSLRAVLAASEDAPSVVVLHGPGGSGKSRFVAELTGHVRREVLALQLGASGDDAATVLRRLSWGGRRGRYAVVIDDADREFDHRVGPVARAIVSLQLDVVLLLTARTGPHENLVYALATRANVDPVAMIALPQLSEDERLGVLRSALAPPIHAIDIERLEEVVRTCGSNLVLLAHAADQLRAGRAPFSFGERSILVREVADKLLGQALDALEGSDGQRVRAFLGILAAIGDVWPEDVPSISEIITDGQSDVAARDVQRWLEVLVRTGVLTRIGQAVTFASDVEGELLLARLATHGTSFLDRLSEEFGARQRFLNNVVMLALWGSSPALLSLPRALLDRHRQTILREGGAWRRAELLESVGPLAQALPNDALDLVDETLEKTKTERPWELEKLSRAVGVVMTHALVAAHAERSTAQRCLELAASPFLANVDKNKDQATGSLRAALNPYPHGVGAPKLIVDALECWLRGRTSYSDRERTVLVALLIQVLSPTVDYFRSSDRRSEVTHYTRPLPATGEWGDLNDRGWNLWRDSILTHADATLRAELLAGMARAGLNTSMVKSDLARRNIERRLELLSQLEETVETERSLEALAAIQKAALWHWLRLEDASPELDGVLSEPARRVLAKIPRSLELNLYGCLWTPLSALDDLERLTAIPAKERRNYGFGDDRHVIATHQRVATAALDRATTPDALASLLSAVAPAGASFSGDVPPVIVLLVRDGYRLVDALMRDPDRRSSLPTAIAAMLERVWVERATDGLALLVERIGDLRRCSPDDAFQAVHAAIVEAHRGRTEEALAVLRQVVGHRDPDTRSKLETAILYAEVLTPEARMELLAELIRGEAGRAVLRSLAWSLEHRTELLGGTDRSPLRASLLSTAEENPQLVDGLFVRLFVWCCQRDTATLLDGVDALIARAGKNASLGFYLAEEVLADLDVDGAGLETWLAAIERRAAAGQLPLQTARELRRSLLSSLPQASDQRLDHLLAAETLDLQACLEVLRARRFPSRFEASAPRWIVLLRRAQREVSGDLQRELVGDFLLACLVQDLSSLDGELPPTLRDRATLFDELEQGLTPGDALPREALRRARSQLDGERTQWLARAAERRAGKRPPH